MMRITPLFKTTLLAASLLSLSACGSDGDGTDSETPRDEGVDAVGAEAGEEDASETVEDIEGVDDAETVEDVEDVEDVEGAEDIDGVDAGEDTDGPETVTPGGNADLNDATPRFLTMACGEMPIADVPFSSSASAPAVFTTNTVVNGRIDPGSGSNTENFWSVDLQPGFYHLVQDATRLDGRRSNLGLDFSDVSNADAGEGIELLSNSEIGYHVRDHVFLEIEQARTMTIRVTPRFGAEDYTFGLFGNGTAVPSPFFDDCPTITPISLGTTEALTIPSYQGVDDEKWFSIDLEAQDYVLSSTATRTDGTDRNIIYESDYGSQFGKTSRFEQVGRISELGITRAEDSSALRPSEAGGVWIRLRSTTELSVEFTLQPEG